MRDTMGRSSQGEKAEKGKSLENNTMPQCEYLQKCNDKHLLAQQQTPHKNYSKRVGESEKMKGRESGH